MKRPLIITAGIVIILAIFVLWGYLLLYGAPKKVSEVFTNLGVIPENELTVREVAGNVPISPQNDLALNGSELEQLTTRAVAGFIFSSTTAHIMRYVERGTGHIYEIDLDDTSEKQITLTTIPQTVDAVFSFNGEAVTFTSFEDEQRITTVSRVVKGETSLELRKLPLNADNIAFKNESTVYFTLPGDTETLGYTFNLNTLEQTRLFNIPMLDGKMLWGEDFTSIAVLPKPTLHLEGAVYSITANTLVPLVASGFGRTAFMDSNHIISSHIDNNAYISSSHTGDETKQQGILMLDEKCAFDVGSNEGIWCAAPLTSAPSTYLEDWYKGKVTSEDYVWFTDLSSQSSKLVGNLPLLSGRTLDVFGLTSHADGSLLLFSNKLDQSLWIYRTESQ